MSEGAPIPPPQDIYLPDRFADVPNNSLRNFLEGWEKGIVQERENWPWAFADAKSAVAQATNIERTEVERFMRALRSDGTIVFESDLNTERVRILFNPDTLRGFGALLWGDIVYHYRAGYAWGRHATAVNETKRGLGENYLSSLIHSSSETRSAAYLADVSSWKNEEVALQPVSTALINGVRANKHIIRPGERLPAAERAIIIPDEQVKPQVPEVNLSHWTRKRLESLLAVLSENNTGDIPQEALIAVCGRGIKTIPASVFLQRVEQLIDAFRTNKQVHSLADLFEKQ